MKKLLQLLLLTLTSSTFADSYLDFTLSDFCYEQPGVQDRGGVYYFPNEEVGITASSVCVYKDLHGQYMSKVGLLNGNFDGQFITWYYDGQKASESNYINGKLNGKWTDWRSDGRIFFEKNYIDGNLVAESEFRYFDNGQIKSITNFIDNNMDGKQTGWYENSQIKYEANYKDSELLTETIWDENGQESNYEAGSLKSIVERHENGQIKSAMYYDGFYWNGNYEGWHDNGARSYKGAFYLKRFNAESEHNNWDRDGNVESFGNLNIRSFRSSITRGQGLENAYKVGLWTYFIDGKKVLKSNENTNFIDGVKWQDKLTYVNDIAAKIKSMWRYQGAEDNWRCMVYVLRDRDGAVQTVDVLRCHVGDSNQAKAFKNSIERAVFKSSPLPAPPYDDDFYKELTIDFTVN